MLKIKELGDKVKKEYTITATHFAYDGCHKIYIIEDNEDKVNAIKYDYTIINIKELPKVWVDSCSLRFISNWKLTKQYVEQFNNAEFEFKED